MSIPSSTEPDAAAQLLADRLHDLSTKLRALSQSRPAYTPSSCDACLAACKNFVRVTLNMPSFAGNTAPPSSSSPSVNLPANAPPPFVSSDNHRPHEHWWPLSSVSSVFGRDLDPIVTSLHDDLDATWRGMWGVVSSKISTSIALQQYKTCLADCIDDAAKTYPAYVTECVAKATSQNELAKCTERLSVDWAEFRRLEREAQRLENRLNEQV